MIESFETGEAGVLGLRAVGEVTADDYRDVLVPQIEDAIEAGEVRLVFELESLGDYDLGAVAQDAKVGIEFGLAHRAAWRRCAVVTDDTQVARAVRAFRWMMPGRVTVFPAADRDEAVRWAAS